MEHFNADVGFLFFNVETERFTLFDGEVVNLFLFDEFALRQVGESRRMGAGFEHLKEVLSGSIVDRVDLFCQNRPCRKGG